MQQPDVGIVFWILAFVIVLAGLLVVSLKNIFHCALALIVTLSAVSGIFILLDAEFLAAAQVLIYVGAVSILMLFSIMLTSNLAGQRIAQVNQHAVTGAFICLFFVAVASLLIGATDIWRLSANALPLKNTFVIGKLLLTQFMLPFELISVLLVAALMGAIVLARGERA